MLFWNGERCAKTRNTEYENGEKIAGQEFSLCLENTTCSVSKSKQEELTGEEEIKQQQRMAIM